MRKYSFKFNHPFASTRFLNQGRVHWVWHLAEIPILTQDATLLLHSLRRVTLMHVIHILHLHLPQKAYPSALRIIGLGTAKLNNNTRK